MLCSPIADHEIVWSGVGRMGLGWGRGRVMLTVDGALTLTGTGMRD